MPIITQLDVEAPVGVAWPLIPNLAPDFPLTGLAAYFSVDGATLDANGRVASLPLWYGSGSLVQSSAGNAPALTAVNGHDMLVLTLARNDRLIVGPAPGGSAWPDQAAAGCSFFWCCHVLDNSQITGLINALGFRVRAVNGNAATTQFQIQKPYNAGANTQNVNFLADLTVRCVLGFSYDVASNTIKLYRNGVLLGQQTSVNWGALGADIGVYGGLFNPGSGGVGNFGDLLRYTRAVTDAEATQICAYLKTKYAA